MPVTEAAESPRCRRLPITPGYEASTANGLLEFSGGAVTIFDPDVLKIAAQFNGHYLHLDRVHDATPIGRRAGDLV
jgi:hypothetical protein